MIPKNIKVYETIQTFEAEAAEKLETEIHAIKTKTDLESCVGQVCR